MAHLLYDTENAVWYHEGEDVKIEALTECKNGCGQTVKHKQMAWGDSWACTAGCGYFVYFGLGD